MSHVICVGRHVTWKSPGEGAWTTAKITGSQASRDLSGQEHFEHC